MNFSYLYIQSPNGKTPWKKSPPGGETPCLWRTEKHQNCTRKMPNVTSETHRNWCFWLLFPLAVAMNFGYLYIRSLNGKTPWKKSLRQILLLSAASNKTPSKKLLPGGETPCLWRTEKPQKPIENDAFGSFFLLLLLWILATFSSCYCRGFCFCCGWSPDGKTPWKKSPPGRETPYLWRTEKPQNCTPKMPK